MEYELIRSARRSIGMELKSDGTLLVRAPLLMPKFLINRFLESHRDWIERKQASLAQRNRDAKTVLPLTEQEHRALLQQAKKTIPERVAYYAPLVGVTYGKVTIRSQRTRWGSCSSKGNLNFNCLLLLAPPEVLDSVVVHELCHRKEMNHSKRFYAEVLRVFPGYRKWDRWLKQNGALLQKRLPKKSEISSEKGLPV